MIAKTATEAVSIPIPKGLSLLCRGRNGRVLLEEEPQYRLYDWHGNLFYLPFPWLYYSVTVWHSPSHGLNTSAVTKLYCCPKPIRAVDQSFARMPLPNLYSGRPCYSGSDKADYGAAIAQWWNQQGNTDAFPERHRFIQALAKRAGVTVSHNAQGYGSACKAVFQEWERLSIEEVLAMPFGRLQMTPRSLLGTSATLTFSAQKGAHPK